MIPTKDNEVQKISYLLNAHRPTYFTTIILSSVDSHLRTREATTALLCRLDKGCVSLRLQWSGSTKRKLLLASAL